MSSGKSRQRKLTHSPNRTSGPVVEVKGEKHFRELVTAFDGPVVVDFWAPWCGPCKAMGPVFERAAREHQGAVRFLKVNTEANQALAQAFNIRSIPSLLIFVHGEVYDAHVGLASSGHLSSMLLRAIDKHEGRGIGHKIKRFFGAARDEGTTPEHPSAS
ncbi:MAG: thioredoxin [Deltaproteobacteria bacterium RIFOXYA12_FULL_58_15]|nr:MAG: thioredoxin [Deltaproteobacteria bacterium RIFOXYA12_FULL_58_15]OGR15169.1 MAG: thioredoxin [Deltaproteobacteria bacterium RIFOXYB12_FULL_58_9]